MPCHRTGRRSLLFALVWLTGACSMKGSDESSGGPNSTEDGGTETDVRSTKKSKKWPSPPVWAGLVARPDGASVDLSQPLAGVLEWDLQVSDGAQKIEQVTMQVNDQPVEPWAWNTAPWSFDTSKLTDGAHTLTMVVHDAAGRALSEQWHFHTDHTPPEVQISPQSTQALQGHAFPILLKSDAAELSVRFMDQERSLYVLDEAAQTHRALVGIPIPTEPGPYPIEVTASDALGNQVVLQSDVEVEAYSFQKGGYIRLSQKQTKARKNREAIDQANADRRAAYAVDSPKSQWGDGMVKPMTGRRTSEFGKYRTYSDGAKKPHYGTDWAAPVGTPIVAAAGGTVTLAKLQVIYGNVVIIDHGHGISTSYNHLNSIDVQLGDSVTMGEKIGTVGSTGQSTGPHLHWGMTVSGLSVNAEQWVGESFAPDPDEMWMDMAVKGESPPTGSPVPIESGETVQPTP